ncbi:DUF397 domain-containing protein [Actinomadura flavalba]|uniref:DUF397 domain-containing protein n=1 Tax=Actinomadura flavalba TaxID=1120938 RepID=UPI003B838F71
MMIDWRKSSRSAGNAEGNCVEVSTNVLDAALIRDSKNPSGPRLSLGRPELGRLVGHIKSGALDL